MSDQVQDSSTVLKTSKSDLLGPQAVDIEAVKARSSIMVTPTATQVNFAATLAERDLRCIFTSGRAVNSTHIIPFAKQDEVSNRRLFMVLFIYWLHISGSK